MPDETPPTPLTTAQLDAGLAHIRSAPTEMGTLDLIVRRPDVDQREVLASGTLDSAEGLVGDSWKRRPSRRTPDHSAHPDMQLNVINSRLVALIAQTPERWALAGDQLYVDLDLSAHNLPAGTRLRMGQATIEVTDQPHTGCTKFTRRFGLDAHRWVNSEIGKSLRLRGLNAKVIVGGTISVGDTVTKL